MPTPRKYATNAERQAAYRARCAMTPRPGLAMLPQVPGSRRWSVQIGQARGLLEEVIDEMAMYGAARSDAWYDSERGERFTERLETLEEILDLLHALPEA